jgi:hypothetical protein
MAALVNSTYGLDISVYDQIAAGPPSPLGLHPASTPTPPTPWMADSWSPRFGITLRITGLLRVRG